MPFQTLLSPVTRLTGTSGRLLPGGVPQDCRRRHLTRLPSPKLLTRARTALNNKTPYRQPEQAEAESPSKKRQKTTGRLSEPMFATLRPEGFPPRSFPFPRHVRICDGPTEQGWPANRPQQPEPTGHLTALAGVDALEVVWLYLCIM